MKPTKCGEKEDALAVPLRDRDTARKKLATCLLDRDVLVTVAMRAVHELGIACAAVDAAMAGP